MKTQNTPTTSRLKQFLVGFGLLCTCLLAGATLGLLYVKLFVPAKAMGWDGIADALGGAMIGGLIGLLAGAYMIWRLSLKAQGLGIVAALAIVATVFTGLVLSAPQRDTVEEPVVKEAPGPFILIKMRIGHSKEILDAVAVDSRPFPFIETEVFSSKPEIIHIGWGPEFRRCVFAPKYEEIATLLPLLAPVMSKAGPACRTGRDALNLSVSWNLDGARGSQSLDTGCLDDYPEVPALAEAIGKIAAASCAVR